MKTIIKTITSYFGLWAFYDLLEWRHNFKKLKNENKKTLSDWRQSLSTKRKGDVFFILGSGYSINNVTNKQWEEISKGMSIGFNNWFYHEFIPDCYGLELSKNESLNQIRAINLKKSNPDLFNRPLFLHYKHAKNSQFDLDKIPWPESKIFFNLPFSPHTFNKGIIKRLIGYSIRKKNVDRLLHYSASIAMWADLGVALGYKKIVFVGVDMNDPRYFYYAPNYTNQAHDQIKIEQDHYEKSRMNLSIHPTVDKRTTMKYGSLPVDEFLFLYLSELQKRNPDYQFFVSHPSSRLAQKFKVWGWNLVST